jgi:hypothetical protein
MRKRRGSGDISTITKLLAILFIGTILLYGAAQAGIDIPYSPFNQAQTGGGGDGGDDGPDADPTIKTPGDYPTAIVTTDVAGFDTLDISTSRTIGSDINVLWYRYQSGWIQLGSGDATDITVQEADNNNVYCVIQFPGSPSYYVDYQKILDMNTHLSWYSYEDITGDSVEEFVFKCDISGATYASATGKWNMPLVNVFLLTDDTGSFDIPSGGQPSDQTGIGESTVTKYVKWYGEISAEKKGIALYKVGIKANTSDISKIALKKVNIPGIGYLDGSSFTQDVLSSETKWTYTISENILYGANYLERPVNDPNEFKFTTAVELDLATDDVITLTLYLYQLDASESSVSDSDAVNLAEA